MLVGLRVTDHFPYEMLILEVEQSYQNPVSHRLDTLYYRLANEDGDFIEKGINYFQYETQGVTLDLKKGQTGRIKIRHLMHREVLPGIMDVGIHVVR
jgi:gliding motility-associated lipoprotein GldH